MNKIYLTARFVRRTPLSFLFSFFYFFILFLTEDVHILHNDCLCDVKSKYASHITAMILEAKVKVTST